MAIGREVTLYVFQHTVNLNQRICAFKKLLIYVIQISIPAFRKL